jgi:hypothetical protein
MTALNAKSSACMEKQKGESDEIHITRTDLLLDGGASLFGRNGYSN